MKLQFMLFLFGLPGFPGAIDQRSFVWLNPVRMILAGLMPTWRGLEKIDGNGAFSLFFRTEHVMRLRCFSF